MDIDAIPQTAGTATAPPTGGKKWNDWLGTAKKVGTPPKDDPRFQTLAKLIDAEAELTADNCDGFKAKFWTFVTKFQGALDANLIRVEIIPQEAPAEVPAEVEAPVEVEVPAQAPAKRNRRR